MKSVFYGECQKHYEIKFWRKSELLIFNKNNTFNFECCRRISFHFLKTHDKTFFNLNQNYFTKSSKNSWYGKGKDHKMK